MSEGSAALPSGSAPGWANPPPAAPVSPTLERLGSWGRIIAGLRYGPWVTAAKLALSPTSLAPAWKDEFPQDDFERQLFRKASDLEKEGVPQGEVQEWFDKERAARRRRDTTVEEKPRPKPIPPPPGTVRITRRRGDCPIGPHSQMQPICARDGQQAHHVVPDRTFRQAGPGSARFAGSPSYGEGLAVCVQSNRAGPDSEHSIIHNQYYDPTAQMEAANGSNPGLITLGRAENLGSQALEKGTDGRCPREYIRSALRSYHNNRGLEPDTLVRGQKGPLDATTAQGLGQQAAGRQNR